MTQDHRLLQRHLFPVEMQRLPQLMSLFPVSSCFFIQHCSSYIMGLATFSPLQQIQHRAFRHYTQTVISKQAIVEHATWAILVERHVTKSLEQLSLVTRAERVLGFLKVWSCWARDSVASKTHWDCNRLCLRRICPPLDKASAAILASMKGLILKKIPLAWGREKSRLAWITKTKRHTGSVKGSLEFWRTF